ncbi:hypothetical protein AB4133_03140 [Vibrio sp. 10N.286.52.F8]
MLKSGMHVGDVEPESVYSKISCPNGKIYIGKDPPNSSNRWEGG